ncbi:MAG: hypothetical protein JKX68_00610 [Flavobacteriales bacterium]|nr:hypothetical protein [Flavobacteriales bacterium]
MKKLLYIFLLYSCIDVVAQNSSYAVILNVVTTNGIRSDNPLKHTTVVLYDGKNITQLSTNENGLLITGIPKNKKLIITFKKERFVSKKIEIDTRGKHKKGPATVFKVQIIMIKKKAGYNYKALDFIIAKIYYDKKLKKFKYDKYYNVKMKAKHTKTLKKIENKQLVLKN